jgi:ATP-dependent DNA ligase
MLTKVILNSVPFPTFQPMPLSRARAPFSHTDWLFEIKWDGFRALLYSDKDGVRLISRNGNTFKSFPRLQEGLARDLKGRRCVLNGDIVCLDPNGKPQFRPAVPPRRASVLRSGKDARGYSSESVGSDPDFHVWDGCALACEGVQT